VPAPTYVDGGVVLDTCPYRPDQWRTVRRAWWWHTAAMLVLGFPLYAVAALTWWQRSSRQPPLRRLLWALLMTVAALLVVGLPAYVSFSRRWYWYWRSGTAPATNRLVPTDRPPMVASNRWVALKGAALIDVLLGEQSPAGRATPPLAPGLEPPWAELVAEAEAARARVQRAAARTRGPGANAVSAAQSEAASAVASSHRLAARAMDIQATLRSMNLGDVRRRLEQIDRDPEPSPDLQAAARSLAGQLATAARLTGAL
jgi:hypothetical protein